MAGTRWPPAMALAIALFATGGIILAVVLAVIGHVDADPAYNPLTLTVSDYAVSDRGGPVDLAMVTLGLASLALLVGLRAVRAPVHATAAALFLVWVGGLLASVAVPTDPIGARMSSGGLVHRYASVSAFVSLPLAATVLSHRFDRDRRWQAIGSKIRLLAAASAAGLLVMLYVAFPGHRVMLGLVERGLILVELGLLGVLAVRLFRVAVELARASEGRRPAQRRPVSPEYMDGGGQPLALGFRPARRRMLLSISAGESGGDPAGAAG